MLPLVGSDASDCRSINAEVFINLRREDRHHLVIAMITLTPRGLISIYRGLQGAPQQHCLQG